MNVNNSMKTFNQDKRFNSNENRTKNIKELRLRIENNLSKEDSITLI